MRKTLKLEIACALALVTSSISTFGAITISLNWKEFSNVINDVNSSYGVVEATNWINLHGTTSRTALLDSTNNNTTVDFSISTADASPVLFETFQSDPLSNTPLRSGFQADLWSTRPTLTISDLSATFTSYDVIVYVTGDIGNQGQVVFSAGSNYYFEVPNPHTGTLTQSTDITSADGVDTGTYLRWNGLTADSITLELRTLTSGTDVAIGGVQITGVPEPTTYAFMFGVTTLGFVFWRRRRNS